jgi:hypothetical protein
MNPDPPASYPTNKMSKINPQYEVDLKEQISHVEYDADHHVDLHDAAAAGHLATDEKGNPLVDIDEAASRRLARKVSLQSFRVAS